jgi:predicted short-subunit dehydrogenase-like oxidoreductase (DUF2520 family)
MGPVPIDVTLVGAGQVGRAFAKALRAHAIPHELMPFRRGLRRRRLATELILICVRDGQIPEVVDSLAHFRLGPRTVVAHVSGLLAPDVLHPLRPYCRGVGQLHPFCSIRSVGHARDFAGVFFLGAGDRAAQATLRRLVRMLDARFLRGDAVDRDRYHVAAALLANGTVALLDSASRLLTQARIVPAVGRRMLLELERSVLDNVSRLGLDAALTGPVRRGDIDTLRQHLAVLDDEDPSTRGLYRSLVRSQIEIVRELGELEPNVLRRLQRLLAK